MMSMEILNFSLCLIENVIIYLFFNFLIKKKYNNILLLILIIIVNSILLYSIEDLNLVLKSIIAIFIFLIGSTILFKEKMYLKTALCITLLYIFSITDIIFGNIFSLIFSKHFIAVFYSSFINRFIVCCVIKIIDILIIYLIYRSFKRVNTKIQSSEWLLYNIIIIMFLVTNTIFIIIYSQIDNNKMITLLFLITSITLLFMSLIIIYFFTEICISFQNEKKLYLLESNYSILEQQLTIQNQTSQKLEKIRHDIKNHITNINLLLQNGRKNEAFTLLGQLNNETENIKFELSQSTGNSIIDTVITYKSAICESKNIKFNYRLEPLPKINIDIIDISSALSNLLDNAIEATEKTENPNISIKIFVYKSYLTFVITNTFNTYINDKSGELITSKSDCKNHGYGTQIIKEIAEKYEGEYYWEINKNTFKSTVIVSI